MLLLLVACGDRDPVVGIDAAPPPDADVVAPPDAATPDASTAPRVEVTIEYAGAAEGTLLAAAFTSFPPQGPPGAFAQDSSPVFPDTLVLEGLEPSTVYVLGFLDVDPPSPTQPGPEDLTVWSDGLTLVESETTTVTLTLVDPE